MSSPVALGVVGIGRMGWVHARHAQQLELAGRGCVLRAVVDSDEAKLRRFVAETGFAGRTFRRVEEYVAEGGCEASVVVAPTVAHRPLATMLAEAGQRVLLEKPLTGTLAGDISFCAELEAKHPRAIMLAFQRRYDEALRYGRELLHSGLIGRAFKIYSALEDSAPPPDGYQSDGILPDMSVHNVDEIIWLTGRIPDRSLAVGSVLYNKHIATCKEDFDDATIFFWFGEDLLGQVQVSRNHVSGYRVETAIYGDQGQIQIGRFYQQPDEIVVEAYGRRGAAEPLARRSFPGGGAGVTAPEFVDRYGPAYLAELEDFLACVAQKKPFPVTHQDGLRAQRVIAAAMTAVHSKQGAAKVEEFSA